MQPDDVERIVEAIESLGLTLWWVCFWLALIFFIKD